MSLRLSSQNNQFIFNFPVDFIAPYLYEDFQKLMDKNFIPYDTALDYLNSTIKDIIVPSVSFDNSEQTKKRGKKIRWKESGSVFDKFSPELDITFRSVDSWINYFMLLNILMEFYLNNQKHHIPIFLLQILDKDGSLIYTIIFRDIIIKSISEIRLSYSNVEINEQTFNITFLYNWIDVLWELDDEDNQTSTSIFDIPIQWSPNSLDRLAGNVPYNQFKRGPKPINYIRNS
jgi:hypothetical protein